MEAFNAIDEAFTPRQVANEWRASLYLSTPTAEPIALSDPQTVSFESRLRTIAKCYRRLCVLLPANSPDAPPVLTALDDALSQVASVEASVSSLLALQGEKAMIMLEAIQMYLHVIPEHHPRRRSAIHLLIKLAHRSEQLPISLFVGHVTLQPDSRPLCGGFGDVHPGILAGQTVAVKKLRTIGGDAVTLQRLCREALVWRQIRHPNVLPFIGLNKDIFPENLLPALISPWMPNGSLRDYIRSPKYNAAIEVSLLLSGIANGIAYLHALSITHGDIKHMNILVDSACCPCLADFGLVRLDDSVTTGGFTHTTNGFDFRWTSPQRLNEEVRGASDDVYSFGCVGYYLYAGRVPFEGTTESGTLMRVMRGERPSRPSLGDGCALEPTDDAWNLISRCWAHESDARPEMAEPTSELITGESCESNTTGAPSNLIVNLDDSLIERQSIMHKLIEGEITYVRNLEDISVVCIEPLRTADPPIISPKRLDRFVTNVFRNVKQLVNHHRRILDALQHEQDDEHGHIDSVSVAVFDAFCDFRKAYLKYISNLPIALYRIEDEMAHNSHFRKFHDQVTRSYGKHEQNLKAILSLPIRRLLRYQLLMNHMLKAAPAEPEERQRISQLVDFFETLGKETELGRTSSKRRTEAWRCDSESDSNLVFRPGAYVDMDMLNQNRALVHSCKLLRPPATPSLRLEREEWSELLILLFGDYLVMTELVKWGGLTKYHVSARPIRLDLISHAIVSGTANLRRLRNDSGGGEARISRSIALDKLSEATADTCTIYPYTISQVRRDLGVVMLYAESAEVRDELHAVLEETIKLHVVVQDRNKVFEFKQWLSLDTPYPVSESTRRMMSAATCSVPYNSVGGRALVAVGGAEGVFFVFRHNLGGIYHVLPIGSVTQCAMLEEFGIFLVLAEGCLYAYDMETLVSSAMQSSRELDIPQIYTVTNNAIQFFSVGKLGQHTLVIYMKKRGAGSAFRVLELDQHVHPRMGAQAASSLPQKLFRTYRKFSVPYEVHDLVFISADYLDSVEERQYIAILRDGGFDVMDFRVDVVATICEIPNLDDRLSAKLAKRCDARRPLSMCRSNANEFLLCYNDFGLYVDQHGDPLRAIAVVEWEGTAERVAHHPPYVLLFNSDFIEVRHVETGRLVQLIKGEVRCLWDGRNPTPNGVSTEARVHAMRSASGQFFELVPVNELGLDAESDN